MELLFLLIGTKCCSFTLAAVPGCQFIHLELSWCGSLPPIYLNSAQLMMMIGGAFTMMRDLIIAQKCVLIRSRSMAHSIMTIFLSFHVFEITFLNFVENMCKNIYFFLWFATGRDCVQSIIVKSLSLKKMMIKPHNLIPA